MSEKIIQSYVWYDDKCFFVSTINRESSAMLAPNIYAETLIWEYNYKRRKRGKLIGQAEDIRDGIYTHIEICKNLSSKGCLENGGSLTLV